MTNETQLAKCREDATKAWLSDGLIDVGQPAHTAYIAGYLRRCQETEQAIKDARKQVISDCANFAKDWAMEHVIEDDAAIAIGDYITKSMELKHDN